MGCEKSKVRKNEPFFPLSQNNKVVIKDLLPFPFSFWRKIISSKFNTYRKLNIVKGYYVIIVILNQVPSTTIRRSSFSVSQFPILLLYEQVEWKANLCSPLERIDFSNAMSMPLFC